MVTYFLYPRKVLNLAAEAKEIPPINGPVYALIAKGSWYTLTNPQGYGWPKIPINASQIWRFDVANNIITQYSRNYNPAADQWEWGLIEVHRD